MRRELERQSTGLLSRHVRVRAPGDAPASPLVAEEADAPVSETGARTGMSVRLGPRGPTNSPVAQWKSSALMRRRSVDRDHLGLPGSSTAQEVCHETDRRRRRVLSRSRASDARASRLKPGSSAVTASCAARRSSARSSVATTHAPAAPRGRFKHCCLRSGCF